MTLTERERIEHLKKVLIHYATEEDKKTGNYKAIQAVQKMAGYSSEKDYLYAITDGIKYGNWPWVTIKIGEDAINPKVSLEKFQTRYCDPNRESK